MRMLFDCNISVFDALMRVLDLLAHAVEKETDLQKSIVE